MPPVYQPTPDISSNLRRHRKKKSISGYHRQLNNVRSEEPLSGISPQHAQNYRISKCALYDFSLITYWGPWPYCKKKKIFIKKNLYNPESIGTLKSPWKLVTLSVIALSLPDFNTHIMIHVLQLNNNHVHSYFCLKEIFTRFF